LRRPHVKFSLLRTDDPCTCMLTDEVCSCGEAMRLMNCIVDACTSGKCACEPYTLHDTCVSVAGTCSALDIRCKQEKAECMDEESSRSLPEANSTEATRMAADMYDHLRDLKDQRCRLKLAVQDGWLNAKKRLEKVEAEIKRQMEDLTMMRQPLPEMHCEKHFEEWHEPPEVPESMRAPMKVEVAATAAPSEAPTEAPETVEESANATTGAGEPAASAEKSTSAKQGVSHIRIAIVLVVVLGAVSVIVCAMRTART